MPDLISARVSLLPAIAKISIPGAPDWIAIAPDAVWVSNCDVNNVARVDRFDQATNHVTAGIAATAGDGESGIAATRPRSLCLIVYNQKYVRVVVAR
jgi:hypothetical protein